MLYVNPPLGALHGDRLDLSKALAHTLIDTVAHVSASTLRLHAQLLDRLTARLQAGDRRPPAFVVLDLATDPSLTRLGVDAVKERIHLTADLGAQWIAIGEWHQHGLNAVFANWLAHCREQLRGLPAASGLSVMMAAVESADRSVAQAAVVAVDAAEAVVEVAVEESERPGRVRRR